MKDWETVVTLIGEKQTSLQPLWEGYKEYAMQMTIDYLSNEPVDLTAGRVIKSFLEWQKANQAEVNYLEVATTWQSKPYTNYALWRWYALARIHVPG